MKTIIAGSRDATREETFRAILECGFAEQITEVISGCARGADTHGEEWAKIQNLPIRRFLAEWKRYGKAAGPIRNNQMAECGEALIAVWKNRSRGTENMIDAAYKHNLLVTVIELV